MRNMSGRSALLVFLCAPLLACGENKPKRQDTVPVQTDRPDARRVNPPTSTTSPDGATPITIPPAPKNGPEASAPSSGSPDAGSPSTAEDAAIAEDTAPAAPPRVPYAPDPAMPREAKPASTLIIDDFEDCDGALYPQAGRIGTWFTYREENNVSTFVDPAVFTAIAGGAPGSTACSTRVVGEIGFNSFGGAGSPMAEMMAYDASTYGGISFWAKGTGTIRVVLQTDAILPATAGGTCEMGCYDAHGADVELTTEWKKYEFTWAQMLQEGWGTAAMFDPSKARNLQWQFKPGPFDLYLDDVRFLAGGKPTDAGVKNDGGMKNDGGSRDAGADAAVKRDTRR